jgi:hypothetical protein
MDWPRSPCEQRHVALSIVAGCPVVRLEHIDTVALGWTGRDVYVRVPDQRYRLTSVWLDAADVTRR